MKLETSQKGKRKVSAEFTFSHNSQRLDVIIAINVIAKIDAFLLTKFNFKN